MLKEIEKRSFALGKVKVLLAEPRTQLRRDLTTTLNEFGLRIVEQTGNLNKVHERLAIGDLDLLICDTVLPEGDLRDLLKSVRFGETISNPFLIVITLISDPTAETLREMMACGPDAIVVKPFTPEQLIERIESLIHHRKRFAVTADYVGPERRQGNRKDNDGRETIRVPNPLYIKAFGTEDLAITKRANDTAITHINNQMVESYAQKSIELITELHPTISKLNWTEKTLGKLNELRATSFDLNKRIALTDYKSLGGLTTTLDRMLNNIHKWTTDENKGDIKLLSILSEILQRGFDRSELPPVESYLKGKDEQEENSPEVNEIIRQKIRKKSAAAKKKKEKTHELNPSG